MISDSLTFISWLLVVVFFGAVAFMLDNRIGIPLYHWWYGMTHREGLPAGVRRGFIVGQRAQERFVMAFILATAHAVFATFVHSAEPLREILTWMAEIPVLMIGFYAGPHFEALWKRKDDVLETVNKVETGELSLSAEIVELSKGTAEKVRGALREVAEQVTEEAPQSSEEGSSSAHAVMTESAPVETNKVDAAKVETPSPEAPQPTTTEAEGRAMLKRFIRD